MMCALRLSIVLTAVLCATRASAIESIKGVLTPEQWEMLPENFRNPTLRGPGGPGGPDRPQRPPPQ